MNRTRSERIFFPEKYVFNPSHPGVERRAYRAYLFTIYGFVLASMGAVSLVLSTIGSSISQERPSSGDMDPMGYIYFSSLSCLGFILSALILFSLSARYRVGVNRRYVVNRSYLNRHAIITGDPDIEWEIASAEHDAQEKMLLAQEEYAKNPRALRKARAKYASERASIAQHARKTADARFKA